ncbi:MAG: hypothetical protein ACJAUR_000678 [Ulvibacter sp.]|jgi:hypothetical protein
MQKFKSIFKKNTPYICVIYMNALAGTSKHVLSSSQIIDEALQGLRY